MISVAVLWVSLIGLIANDHWLKYEAMWPRWLAGKLSDFVGLLLAIALVITITGARSKRASWICAAGVALPFAAVNLSSTAAALLTQAMTLIGMSWRLWPDPWDLLALLVIPVALMLGRALTQEVKRGRVSTRWFVPTAAVACLASGESKFNSAAYFVNATDEPVVVEVSFLRGQLHCHYSDLDLQDHLEDGFLRHSDFADDAIRYEVEPQHVLPLDAAGSRACGVTRIELQGHAVAVAWLEGGGRWLPSRISDSELEDRQRLVVLEETTRAPEVPRLAIGEKIHVFELAADSAPWPESACAAATIPRLSYSLPNGASDVWLSELRSLGADCFSFELSNKVPVDAVTDAAIPLGGDAGKDAATELDAGADAAAMISPNTVQDAGFSFARHSTGHICGASDLFPFELGDPVMITRPGFIQIENRKHGLRLWRDRTLYPRGLGEPEPSDCGLVRDPCGAIWQPLDLPETRALGSDTVERRARALRTVLAREECAEELQRIGEWYEVVEVGNGWQ